MNNMKSMHVEVVPVLTEPKPSPCKVMIDLGKTKSLPGITSL